jgi:hypothetical protein
MTLEDLVETFRNHPTTREGVKAVVEALHNEVMCRNGEAHIDELFMEILASDGVMKP